MRGNAEMTGADVRLEWATGAIERSAEEIDARLGEVVARWLAGASEEESASPATADPAVSASAA